jgi:rare lipoprotein A
MFSRRILQAFYRHAVEHYFSNVIQVPTVLMSPPASSSKRSRKSASPSAHRGRAAATFVLALAFLASMVWDAIESRYAASLAAAIPGDLDSGIVVLSLAAVGARTETPLEIAPDAQASSLKNRAETCDEAVLTELSRLDLPMPGNEPASFAIVPQIRNDIFESIRNPSASMSTGGTDLISFAQNKVLAKFAPAYRSVLRLAAFMGLPRIQSEAVLNNAIILGTVSTYNPYRDGIEEGGTQTASGELYDPAAWTAAVQTDLRDQFGGVRYGKLYQPTFALVESGAKQVIVKINDVGRLKPGRVLDLNERSMRYFDPFLSRGLIEDVRITLLPGEDWTPGPVGGVQLISLASTSE